MISGSLVLVLDDNKRVLMKPGDVIVQRGTIHAWVNETDEWTRMYFVLIRAFVLLIRRGYFAHSFTLQLRIR